MVVCRLAAPAGVAAILFTSNGANSQLFATAMRTGHVVSGASARSISAGGPAKRIGNGCDVIASTAWASVSTPVCGGGADECPPLAGAVMRSVP